MFVLSCASCLFSSRRRQTRCALVTVVRRVLVRSHGSTPVFIIPYPAPFYAARREQGLTRRCFSTPRRAAGCRTGPCTSFSSVFRRQRLPRQPYPPCRRNRRRSSASCARESGLLQLRRYSMPHCPRAWESGRAHVLTPVTHAPLV